jgi:hypothetical protein
MAKLKVWNGTSWISPYFTKPRVWNGTAWVYAAPKYWDGSAWRRYRTLDTQTVTVGQSLAFDNGLGLSDFYGYSTVAAVGSSFGSISDGTSNIYSGGSITELYYEYFSDYSNLIQFSYMNLAITGATDIATADGGWDKIILNGTTFNRSDAFFSPGGSWVWQANANYGPWYGGSPFGSAGTSTVVTFL